MEKKIIVSDIFHAANMIYIQKEKRWKSTYIGFYETDQASLEDQNFQINIYFSEKGKIELDEKDKGIFNKIKSLETYENHFKYCKEVIEEIDNMKNVKTFTFSHFHYNFKEKEGRFRFEKSSLHYNFSLIPSEGINELYIQYRGLNWNVPRVRVKGHPSKIFGQLWTNILNDMIKKELKLRFFF